MKLLFVASFAVIIVIAMLSIIEFNRSSKKAPESRADNQHLTISTDNNYLNCRNFILNKLMSKDGSVYTNYLNEKSNGDITKGHDILCESQGILMLYAVKSGDRRLFDNIWTYVSSKMLNSNGLIAWRVENGAAASGNATVDDFRIANALCKAYTSFKNEKYKAAAEKLSSSLLNYCIRNNLPVQGANDSTVLLSYVDLGAIKSLAAMDNNWSDISDNSLRLIRSGKLSGNLPFYNEQYSTENERFIGQSKYSLLSSALTVLYQSEIGKADSSEVSWLLKHCTDNGLFSEYDGSGNPASNIESSSIYAITMLIAENTSNKALYSAAKKRLLDFQVKDIKSPIFGAFGNEKTLEVYSFDNLLALLALTPVK